LDERTALDLLHTSSRACFDCSGIAVTAIAPGMIETEMFHKEEKLCSGASPMDRFGQLAEVAGMTAFFCSEDTGFIVG
jgi:NAD(P)-dependent dehydrogenase (short-subunit alcohol dehydrogenase family)